MRFPSNRSLDYVLRPSVTFAIVFVGLAAIWFLWLSATARYPVVGEEGIPMITRTQLVGASAINALLLAGLVLDGRAAWRNAPGLRRGQLAGVLAAAVTLLVVQLGFVFGNAILVAR